MKKLEIIYVLFFTLIVGGVILLYISDTNIKKQYEREAFIADSLYNSERIEPELRDSMAFAQDKQTLFNYGVDDVIDKTLVPYAISVTYFVDSLAYKIKDTPQLRRQMMLLVYSHNLKESWKKVADDITGMFGDGVHVVEVCAYPRSKIETPDDKDITNDYVMSALYYKYNGHTKLVKLENPAYNNDVLKRVIEAQNKCNEMKINVNAEQERKEMAERLKNWDGRLNDER